MTTPAALHTVGHPVPRRFRGPPSIALLLALVLGGACDEGTAQKMLRASQAIEGANQQPAAPAASADAPIAAYDRCYRDCYTTQRIPTNRETCKLDCDSLAEDDLKTRSEPLAQQALPHLRGCLTDCWDRHGLSETDRETCLLTCDDDASIALTPPPKQRLEVVPGTVLTPSPAPR